MKNLVKKNADKPIYDQELVEFAVFAPLAEFLVPYLAKTRLHPNQVSYASAFFAAFALLVALLNLGAMLIVLCIFLVLLCDTIDGMLARYKGLSNPLGRVVDGSMDYISSFFMFVAIIVFFSKEGRLTAYPIISWILIILSFPIAIIHVLYLDFFKNRLNALGNENKWQEEISSLEEIVFTKEKGFIFNFAINRVLGWNKKILNYVKCSPIGDVRKFKKKYIPFMFLWHLLGHFTHFSFLIVSLITENLIFFFCYNFIFANFLFFYLLRKENNLKKYYFEKTSYRRITS